MPWMQISVAIFVRQTRLIVGCWSSDLEHIVEVELVIAWFEPTVASSNCLSVSGPHERMCTLHVDSTNPGRSNLVFRSDQSRKLRCRIGLLCFLSSVAKRLWNSTWHVCSSFSQHTLSSHVLRCVLTFLLKIKEDIPKKRCRKQKSSVPWVRKVAYSNPTVTVAGSVSAC